MADYFEEDGWKFVMLTNQEGVINESPLTIDLNTRMISVPSAVTTCAGVQKDQMAESLIFEVDRFFDYMDLTNTKIHVQWKNGEHEGDQRITMIDFASKPGKILFAWTLTDDVTAIPGTVKFSVRFFIDNVTQEKLNYSLNTQEASMTIKPALAPNLNELVVDPHRDKMFKDVILNSKNARVGTPFPRVPQFGGQAGRDMSLLTSLGNNSYGVSNLKEVDNTLVANLIENALSLCAQAYTTDLGTLTYTWYHVTNTKDSEGNTIVKKYSPVATHNVDADGNTINEVANGSVIQEIVNSSKVRLEYIKISNSRLEKLREDNAKPEPNVIYYERVSTSPVAYKKYAGTFPIEDSTVLYEEFSVFSIPDDNETPITGKYYVSVVNTLEGVSTSNKPVHSRVCVLPEATDIVLEQDLADALIITDEAELKVVLPENIYGADRSYTWYYSADGSSFEDLEIANATDTYETTALGWYKVHIASTLNREPKYKTSNVCKVTYAPIQPSISNISGDDFYRLDSKNTKSVTLQVKATIGDKDNDPLYNEKFEYQWYISRNDDDPVRITEADSFAKPNGDKLVIDYTPDEEMIMIQCIASNILNGQVAHSDFLSKGDRIFVEFV